MRVAPRKGKIKETISLGKDRFLDVDDKGRVIGFEILLPKAMPKQAIRAIARSKDTIELVR